MKSSATQFILIVCAILIVSFGIYLIAKKGSQNSGNSAVEVNLLKSDILKVRGDDNIRGDRNASISIVVYSDYQCPYCVIFDKTMSQIISVYPGQVKWVYRHFPLPFHKAAKKAAIAVEAAGRQGKYWEFHDKLVENSQSDGKGLSEGDLLKYAKELGLEIDKFKNDLEDQRIKDKVEFDISSGTQLEIQGTPASYLIAKNGNVEQLEGALSFDQLKSKIDAANK